MTRYFFSLLLYILSLLVQPLVAQDMLGLSDVNISYNLENRLVKGYLDEADEEYTSTIGRTGTSMLNYDVRGKEIAYYAANLIEYPDSVASWEEQPAPVSFSVPEGVTLVSVSSSPLFVDSLAYDVSGDSAHIYNLIPRSVYWYRCYDDTLGLLKQGIFKTQGRVRMLACPNVRNLRDMGGWPCAGGHIAYGKLLRSATMDFVHANSVNEHILVDQIGLRYDMDLRHEDEEEQPDWSTTKVEYGNYSLFGYMWLMTSKYWSESKQVPASSGCRSRYGEALKQFVANLEAGKCTNAHCSGGADRTGMFCMLTGALCGMSEEDLVKDWELTTFSNYFKMIDVENCDYYEARNGQYVNVHAEMRSVFKYLYKNFGGSTGATLQQQVESWLKKYVITNTETFNSLMTRLRNNLVVPDQKSPIVMMEVGNYLGESNYTLTNDETEIFASAHCDYIDAQGELVQREGFAASDYIDCTGFTHILLNRTHQVIGAYYDAQHNYLGSILDDTIEDDQTVLFGYKEYAIPEGAASVRLNLAQFSDMTAVFAAAPYLPE